jgi:hypothetical protein
MIEVSSEIPSPRCALVAAGLGNMFMRSSTDILLGASMGTTCLPGRNPNITPLSPKRSPRRGSRLLLGVIGDEQVQCGSLGAWLREVCTKCRC